MRTEYRPDYKGDGSRCDSAPGYSTGRARKVNKGELDKAKRRALRIFDDWIEVTGALEGGWLWECESIIEDAVEIGVQEALGDRRTLESEKVQQ